MSEPVSTWYMSYNHIRIVLYTLNSSHFTQDKNGNWPVELYETMKLCNVVQKEVSNTVQEYIKELNRYGLYD